MPLFPGSPAWAPWTPTFAGLTVGNGVLVGRYVKLGKTIHYRFRLTWGTTTSASGGTNVSFPVTSVDYHNSANVFVPIGHGRAFDTSASAWYQLDHGWFTTTSGIISQLNTDLTAGYLGQISPTAPMTWATGDELHMVGTYEAA